MGSWYLLQILLQNVRNQLRRVWFGFSQLRSFSLTAAAQRWHAVVIALESTVKKHNGANASDVTARAKRRQQNYHWEKGFAARCA
mmetsp:Transcript_80418/g.134403  ORF Transcript_80418/g.134403 Transcript_80418/m.134403 type:complete len:85 (-) Transcript_80418:150-404(-)